MEEESRARGEWWVSSNLYFLSLKRGERERERERASREEFKVDDDDEVEEVNFCEGFE